jgi:hypothetical protein
VDIGARTQEFERGMRGIRGRLRNLSADMDRWGRRLTYGVSVPLVAASGLMVRAFGVQQKSVNDLRSALASFGDDVDALMPGMQRFASEVQKATVYGDEFVLSLMAQIRNLGITAQKLPEATRGAIGLAKALGLDANAAARYTALAQQGEFTILQRYVPALRTATSAAEKQAIVADLMRRGYKQATDEADTLSGRLAQLKNIAGDLAEIFGEAIAKTLGLEGGMRELTNRVEEFGQKVKELDTRTVRRWVTLGGALIALGPAMRVLSFVKLHPVAATLIATAAAVGYLVHQYNEMRTASERLQKSMESHYQAALKNADATTKAIADGKKQADVKEELVEKTKEQIEAEKKLADEKQRAAERALEDTRREFEAVVRSEAQKLEAYRRTFSGYAAVGELAKDVERILEQRYAAEPRNRAEAVTDTVSQQMASMRGQIRSALSTGGGEGALRGMMNKLGIGNEQRKRMIELLEQMAQEGTAEAVPAFGS